MHLLPLFILAASFFFAVAVQILDLPQRRIRVHAVLPRSKAQIALARVLTPAVIVLLGLAAAQAIMLTMLVGWGAGEFLGQFSIAGFFLFVLQFWVLVFELGLFLGSYPRAQWVVVITAAALVGLYVLGAVAHRFIDYESRLGALLRTIPELSLDTVLGTLVAYGLAGLMTAVSYWLIMRRRSLLV